MPNKNAIEKAKDFLGLNRLPLSFTFVANNPKYDISVIKDDNNVTILYNELATCFYGLSIVKMNLHKKSYVINENKHFKYNGSMFDCSRNQVLNVSTIKEIILVSALMGLNRFMLYTEDVYEIEGEPYFGYLRGRYTKNEIKDIVNYGNDFGVDIIPCIQTLSHLNQALRWAPYFSIADSPNTLNIEKGEIYLLIEKMIKTCRENFSSKYIHIGMDEAADMGLTPFLKENRLIDKKAYFLRHLKKVVGICEKQHFTPMMWIDMFYKLDPKATPDWYDFKGSLEQSIKKEIPNVELVYWNYYDDETNRYQQNLQTALDTGKHITFASGLIRWAGMVSNITPSIKKCSAGLYSAIKNNVDSVFLTTWGDSSSGSTVVTLYVLLALHSVYDYSNGDLKKVSKLLKAITGISLDDWAKLELPNRLRDELLPFENPAIPFLFQDILLGLFDTRVKYQYSDTYHQHYLTLKKVSKHAHRYSYVYQCYASLCDLLSYKAVLGKHIREQYQNHDLNGLKDSVQNIKITIKKLDQFIACYYNQYHHENKVFGYEIMDGRFGFLKQRLTTALKELELYLDGKKQTIPELEEKILPYNGADDDEPHCYNFWNQIISVNNNF